MMRRARGLQPFLDSPVEHPPRYRDGFLRWVPSAFLWVLGRTRAEQLYSNMVRSV